MRELLTRGIFEAIYARRAVREYQTTSPGRGLINELIDAAAQAPSAMNLQPWSFCVIEGVERLADYSEEAKAFLTARQPQMHEAIRALIDGESLFHGAPALVVICATDGERQSAEDCCLAAENLMLAAYSRGLGTCPIGLARPWLEDPATKARLGIRAEHMPVFPVVLGYPRAWPHAHGRRDPAVIWA